MKNYRLTIGIILLAIICAMLQACPNSCDDRLVAISIRNESTDTILFVDYIARNIAPSNEWEFQILNPEDSYTTEYYKSDFEMDNGAFCFWVVRKETNDDFSLAKVIEQNLYDTVYQYSYADLESMDFTVRIRQGDLNKQKE